MGFALIAIGDKGKPVVDFFLTENLIFQKKAGRAVTNKYRCSPKGLGTVFSPQRLISI